MKRGSFLGSTFATVSAASLPSGAFAASGGGVHQSQDSLFAALPRPTSGQWVRFIMGSGVDYQKQIGTATENTEHGRLLYLETQVGTPGGSCNPNTMKRTYLGASNFPSLLDRTAVVANVANSGTTLTRWSDLSGGQPVAAQDSKLQLLDASYLYDDRPIRIVSQKSVTLAVPMSASYAGSSDAHAPKSIPLTTTHTVATFAPPYDAKHRLTRIELWTTPVVPFGVFKIRAIATDLEPFELRLYAHGTHFKTDLAMSLDTIRSITPSGTYVQTS